MFLPTQAHFCFYCTFLVLLFLLCLFPSPLFPILLLHSSSLYLLYSPFLSASLRLTWPQIRRFQTPLLSLLLSFAFVMPCQGSCPIPLWMLLCYLWRQLTGSAGLKLELFHPHLLSFVLKYGYSGGHSAALQY